MKRKYNFYLYFILMISIFVGSMLLVKFFNLTWIDVTEKGAKITINFLIPMSQDELCSHIIFEDDQSNGSSYSYELNWLGPQIVEINISEKNTVKGLTAHLVIKDAPCKWHGFTKSAKIAIPFSVPIQINEANTARLISSTDTFLLSFNTPILLHTLRQHLSSEADFDVAYYEYKVNDQLIKDQTRFILKPKKPLENGKSYILTITSGLKAVSGRLLEKDAKLFLQVDEKPSFLQTYPEAGDKWIGLYPKITFTTLTPIKMAIAKINEETITATMLDEYHGYFLLTKRLSPDITYMLQMQAKAASGELSELKTIHFSTTTVNNKRGWLEISCGSQKRICYYEGEECIKTFICGIGKELSPIDYGTYYIQGKNDVYENPSSNEGANYWMLLNEHFGIHGVLRNSYWEINESKLGDIGGFTEGKNIILSDEDASWLYQKITSQTMVIIRD